MRLILDGLPSRRSRVNRPGARPSQISRSDERELPAWRRPYHFFLKVREAHLRLAYLAFQLESVASEIAMFARQVAGLHSGLVLE